MRFELDDMNDILSKYSDRKFKFGFGKGKIVNSFVLGILASIILGMILYKNQKVFYVKDYKTKEDVFCRKKFILWSIVVLLPIFIPLILKH